MNAIPEIPVASLIATSGKREAEVAAERIVEAATGSGFMVLTGVNSAVGLSADAQERLLRFFALPEAALKALSRRKFEPNHENVYRGVFPLQSGDPTYKEGIDIGPDAIDPGRTQRGGDPLKEPTPWPDESSLPGWRADVATYYGAMERLGRIVASAIANGLGSSEQVLLPLFERGNSTLRVIRYPERPVSSLPKDLTTVAVKGDVRYVVGRPHVDNGFITLLWQDPSGGLQARAQDGAWLDVPPIPGALAVNFGALLADWSGGRVKATEHRVLGGLRERCSIPFFFEPAVDARISPISGEGDDYLYGDRLWERMSAFVEFRGMTRARAADGTDR